MKKALMVRTEFVEKYRDLPGKVAKKAVFRRPKDCLISISPETLLEEKSTAPVTIESWDSPDGLKLVDCVFKPAAKSAPASLGVKAGKNEGFGERKFDLNANGGNLLVIPCGIARGTKLTAEILVDGATYSNSVASHGPNWQELLLPFEGEKIKSLSLRLERAPEIERPAKNSEARLRSILLQKVNRETDALSLSGGKSLKFAEFDGRKNFLLAENKLSAVDQRFVLNERSFSVEAVFTPIKTSNFKIIGTRAAVSPSYTGLPGWALGAAFGKIYFTLEDRDDIVSSARSDHKLFKAYSTCRVLAVRDFENRKLRLYVNGRKFEVDEKGCGNLGDQAKLTVSFDTWSGKSMNGVLEYVKIYERAIPDKEAKEMFEK